MLDTVKIIVMTLIILICISGERYSAERDTLKQLTNEGRTHFIFLNDIKLSDECKIEQIKGIK